MNRVFIWTDKSGVHVSFDSELLHQGFRVAFNQGVVSRCFVDVNLIILQGFGSTGGNFSMNFNT